MRTVARSLAIVAAAAAFGGSIPARAEAEEPAGSASDRAFQPGDISIGEPIVLPFSEPLAEQAAGEEAAAAGQGVVSGAPAGEVELPRTPRFAAPVRQPAAAAASEEALPGNGWLGFAVVESDIAGRWEIDTVTSGGPAAAAGLRPGDEVRAIDGLPLKSSDDVSQAMTAVAPGQEVRLAIARGEQVGDLTITATARPRAASAWAAAADIAKPPATPASPPAIPASPPATLPSPPAAVAAPAAAELPAPRPATASAPPAADSAWPARSRPQPAPPSAGDTAAARRGPAEPRSPQPAGRTALGVRTLPVDPAVQSRFKLPQPSGAYVIGVVSDLPASRAGVPPGSVIVSLDEAPVRSPAELTRLVTSGPLGRPVPLEYVLPGGVSQRAEVVLQALEQPLEAALVGPPAPAATPAPRLEQQPRPAATTVERPVTAFDAGAVSAIRDEIRWLRARLDTLEQRLDGQAR